LSAAVIAAEQGAFKPKNSAGSGACHYAVTQIANAVGIAVVGAVFFAFHDAGAARVALLAALATVAIALIGGCLVVGMRST
jgi:hypothetical protein